MEILWKIYEILRKPSCRAWQPLQRAARHCRTLLAIARHCKENLYNLKKNPRGNPLEQWKSIVSLESLKEPLNSIKGFLWNLGKPLEYCGNLEEILLQGMAGRKPLQAIARHCKALQRKPYTTLKESQRKPFRSMEIH